MIEQDLNLLPALRRLLTEKNISRAAELMEQSQPAMSRSFAKLKKQFNDPLMVRTGNQYQLTPKAQKLLQQLNQLLPQVENLWMSSELDLKTLEQKVVLSGTDMDVIFVSEALQAIQSQAPNLLLDIRASTPRVLEDVVDGHVDLALTAFESDLSGLYRKQVARESFVVVTGEHSHFDDCNLDLEAYMNAKHGKFSFAEPTRGKVDAALEQMGLRRDVHILLPTFLQIPAFLNDPELLFSVPENFGFYLQKQFKIKLLPIPFKVAPIPIYLYWHERLHASPLHRWLREQILSVKAQALI